MKSPGVFVEQGAYEVFSLFCYLIEALLIKLPLSSCDQGQGLCIAVALERRFPAEPGNQSEVEMSEVRVRYRLHAVPVCAHEGALKVKPWMHELITKPVQAVGYVYSSYLSAFVDL